MKVMSRNGSGIGFEKEKRLEGKWNWDVKRWWRVEVEKTLEVKGI
jgi:hypothetical protein